MKSFHIFLNLTKYCNYRCTYCYEKNQYKNNRLNLDNCRKIVLFINKLKNSDFYKSKNYDNIWLTFFGGEPTLNKIGIKFFTDTYKDDNTIFSIITNGSNETVIRDCFKDVYKEKIENMSKVHIQISYDGNPVHDKTRLDIEGNPTSQIVKQTIKNLIKDNYNVTVKSTITPDNFIYLYDAYHDVKSLFSDGAGNYFPTIDYYTEYDVNYKIKDLKDSLIKISAEELNYYKKHNKIFFNWFLNNNNKTCGAGQGMIAIDTDLSVYPCHGAFFENSDEHLIGNINDLNIINEINNRYELLNLNIDKSFCNLCSSSVCFKCNIVKYKNSKKRTYEEKWYDVNNQKYLCNYYILASKIKEATYAILKGVN